MYKNFLTNQYLKDKKNLIKHNYLSEQFRDYKKIFSKIEKVIKFNDFTLGFEVEKFENNFKKLMNSKFCVGVGSGTDAISKPRSFSAGDPRSQLCRKN